MKLNLVLNVLIVDQFDVFSLFQRFCWFYINIAGERRNNLVVI